MDETKRTRSERAKNERTDRESEGEALTHLLEVARDFRHAMLVTRAEDGHLHGRPMAIAELDEEEGAIWFLTARDHASVAEIESDPRALVTMQGKSAYVQWSGRATLVDDAIRLHEVWKPTFSSWFPEGPEGGRIVLVRVDVEIGEYWDESGSIKMSALLKRAKDALGARNSERARPQPQGRPS
jgi:general stress protein 26